MKTSVWLGVLGAVATLVSTSSVQAEARRLTLADAERLALDSNPSLQSVASRAKAGDIGSRAGISRMLPAVVVTDEYQHWNSPFVISFGPQQLQARDDDTNSFAASVNQPLLGLLRLVEEYRAQRAQVGVATGQLKVVQAAVRKGIRVAFLRHFEAKALEEIALQSEKELNEQVQIAQARLKAGVLTHADLLRVKVAAANAQQQGIVAKTQADVARANILIATGSSPDDAIDLVPPSDLLQTSRTETGSYGTVVARALQARPELQVANLTVQASKHEARARLWSMLPDINAEGAYVRVDGQVFAAQNSAYVGIKATWPIWTWGASWFGYQAAQAASQAAQQDLQSQRRQVSTEVASELSQSHAARSAVNLAEQSIASAQEAYRVTDALVKAGSATTTDLLESQSALNQARLNLVRAQYQLALAYVSIQHAVGE